MWVRGLKLIFALHRKKCMTSHPMWVRGLKHQSLRSVVCRSMSHPMWVRGLKPYIIVALEVVLVAPYVGAWIET